jgi:hypothetical protein
MERKKIVYHLGIRIAILILLLIGVLMYCHLTYDPNPYNRHLNPQIGFWVLALFVSQIYCLFLLLEMIYFLIKKNKNLAVTNLVFFIAIEILPILTLIQLTV